MSFWRRRLYFWPFGNPDLQAIWGRSIKLYDLHTPFPPPNSSNNITQNASKRGFFANRPAGGRRSPPNGRKGIRASDTRLSSRGPHSGRWCATGTPHPGTTTVARLLRGQPAARALSTLRRYEGAHWGLGKIKAMPASTQEGVAVPRKNDQTADTLSGHRHIKLISPQTDGATCHKKCRSQRAP